MPDDRAVVPSAPVRFAQLPPMTQQLIHPVVFSQVSFADAVVFQPLEHMPCRTWGRWSEDAQYLASDLKTLRPVPRPAD